ncbi:MAG: thioredoxin family protein [Anaerolineaceae bacterium]|nr:thioredoxin family protein [Anaerolineaceae bacterium]
MAILLVLLLGACGASGEEAVVATSPTVTPQPITDFRVVVASDDISYQYPRIPLILQDGSDWITGADKVEVAAFDLSSGTPALVWQGEATRYDDYVLPYWVVYPQVDHPGEWGLVVDTTLGEVTARLQIVVELVEETNSPAVGEVPPASENRTLATEPDIAKLTSAAEPDPALYQQTIAGAMASGKPSVITFATPGFCQTRYCTPVVDSVSAAKDEFGDAANFIHVEVYKAFNPLVLADEMAEWGLGSEPWTFVLDEDGMVVARLGGPVSPQELADVLEQVEKAN